MWSGRRGSGCRRAPAARASETRDWPVVMSPSSWRAFSCRWPSCQSCSITRCAGLCRRTGSGSSGRVAGAVGAGRVPVERDHPEHLGPSRERRGAAIWQEADPRPYGGSAALGWRCRGRAAAWCAQATQPGDALAQGERGVAPSKAGPTLDSISSLPESGSAWSAMEPLSAPQRPRRRSPGSPRARSWDYPSASPGWQSPGRDSAVNAGRPAPAALADR